MSQEIENKIRSIVRNITDFEYDNQSVFKNFGINSFEFIKLIVEIEKEFEIEFADDDLNIEKYNSIGDLVAYIETLINKR